MKKIILNFETKNKNFKELVQSAFNLDILNFLVSKETYSEFEKVERVTLYSKNPELSPKFLIFTNKEKVTQELSKTDLKSNVGFYFELKTKEDELEIKRLSKSGRFDFVIVSAKDWKVIPFENLIAEMHAKETKLIAEVQSVKEAELMLRTLEIGVDGVLMKPSSPNDIIELKKLLSTTFKIELTKAKVISIKNISESDRICVDTTSILRPGEGMLVGSTAMGFALVHVEVFETQSVVSRPFRINAGDLNSYVLVPNEDSKSQELYRTNYLSKLKVDDRVIIVNAKGSVRIVSVGRVKIETRPMLRFELEGSKGDKKIPISCICQNAETIRLVGTDGTAKSVVNIKVGDEILVHV